MIEQTLGNSLRFLREQQGISLRALAERTDFSASFLSQIENGQCSPSISSMEKIANALGVTLGQFFLSANQQVVNIVRASDRAHMALDWSRAEIASLGSLSNGSQFRASMQLDPSMPEPVKALGDLYVASPRQLFDHAIEAYSRAIDLRPFYADAHARLGDVYARKGLCAESAKAYRRAGELNPWSTRPLEPCTPSRP